MYQKETSRERKTEREGRRQRERQTDRQTDRQRDLHVGRRNTIHTCRDGCWLLIGQSRIKKETLSHTDSNLQS